VTQRVKPCCFLARTRKHAAPCVGSAWQKHHHTCTEASQTTMPPPAILQKQRNEFSSQTVRCKALIV